MNFPTSGYSDAGRGPADRTGIQCAPAPRPRSQDPVPPVRRPAARAAQGPPAQGEPDRDRARRSLTRIRPGQGLLLAVQPPTGRGPRLLPANRPQCPGSPPGGRLGPGRARGQQSDRPGYLADLASGAGNPPTPSNRLDLPLKTAGEPPLKPVGPESRIVVVEEREESPKFACERSRPETPPTLIPDPEYSAAPTPLRAPPVVLDCQPDSPRASPISQPGAAEPLAPAPPVIDPPQPELSVAASAPVVAPPQPQSPPLRKVGLGPRAAYPALRTPSAWSLPAPSPRPGPASLPLTPELSVAAPAPVVAPPQPQSPTLRKLGLGPRAACPAIKTPPAGSPAPSPALPLTPEQQARLAAMPAASRDQVLLWLATGDPILVAEARKKLAPLRPRPRGPQDLARVVGEDQRGPVLPCPGGIRFGSSPPRPKILFGVLAPL